MLKRPTSGDLRHAVLVLLMIIVSGVQVSASIQAQATQANPTPSPAPWVYHWDSQVIYPAAMRFSLVVNRPGSELAQVELTVRYRFPLIWLM